MVQDIYASSTSTWISLSVEILYVLPDNSPSCPSQPCATLNQFVLDNGTLLVVSNVEYHFLPGEHHVPANMTLQNSHNFSIIGTVSKPSPLATVLVLADCSQSYITGVDPGFTKGGGGAQIQCSEDDNCVRSTRPGMQSMPNLGGSGGMPPQKILKN